MLSAAEAAGAGRAAEEQALSSPTRTSRLKASDREVIRSISSNDGLQHARFACHLDAAKEAEHEAQR
jgi:hypothetical protein